MNYNNQKLVNINLSEATYFYNQPGEKDFLHSLSWARLYPILQELNGNEFKIWMYCYKWHGQGYVYFSPATLTQDFGLSESTAQRAFKRLEQLKYLEKIDGKVNSYTFHPNGSRM